jgi:hypothetical protein
MELIEPKRAAYRAGLFLWALFLVAAGGSAIALAMAAFEHSSYRFVALFLTLILLSNLLAKTARAYVES